MDLTRVQSIGIETGVSFTGVTTVTSLNATQGANISLSSVGVAVTIVQSGTGGYVQVGTSSTVAVIDNSGRLLMGVASTTSDSRAVFQASSGSATGGANVFMQRGSTPASGEKLGLFAFADSEGKVGAEISAYADATWSLGDYPGRIVFSTTPDGSSTVTERLRIDDSGNLILASDTDTYIHHPAADTLAVTTGGSERMRIDSSGRMGLGTASPEDPLHVKSNSGAIRLENTVVANNDSTIAYDNTDLAFHVDPNNVRGSSNITFSGDGSERARIDDLGRFLVGTSNVKTIIGFTQKTQVEGTTSTTASSAITRNSNDSGGASLVFSKSRSTSVGGHAQALNSDTLGQILFNGANGTNSDNYSAMIRGRAEAAITTASAPGRLEFHTTAAGSLGPTERMRIDSSGNVGIGANNPTVLLDLESANPVIRFTDSDATGTPECEVSGTGGDLTLRADRDNEKASSIIGFEVDGTERVRIDNGGRLLVGTTSSRDDFYVAATYNPQIQNEGTSLSTSMISNVANSNNPYGSYLILGKSRGTTAGSNTLVSSSDTIGIIDFMAADGAKMCHAASIAAIVDGTPAESDMPTRLVFATTADGASGPSERMRIRADGAVVTTSTTILNGSSTVNAPRPICFNQNEMAWTAGRDGGTGGTNLLFNCCDVNGNLGTDYSVYFRGLASSGSTGALINIFEVQSSQFIATGAYSSTTSSGANVVVGTNGRLYRSTSSAQYKTNIETLEDSYADALLSCRPVWYQSTASDSELHPDWGYWGFIAEEVAEIDPRLVSWKTHEETTALDGTKTVEELAEPIAEGVQYDRFVPHLLNLIKRQQQAIETLQAKVAALEAN